MDRVKWWWGPGRGYRDIWLIIITVIVVIAAIQSRDASTEAESASSTARSTAQSAKGISEQNREILVEIQESRETGLRINCRNNTAQDDVLRAVLLASIQARRDRGVNGDRLTADEAERLATTLMEPLGGLTPTEKQKQERCERQVERSLTGDGG
jgi:hypothetical protein